MGGARGDWLRSAFGAIIGNVFGGCKRCHAYCDDHKLECQVEMIRIAIANGDEAIEMGITPILRGGRT